MHAGDEVAEERQHLDGGETQHHGELLLEEPNDLEGLEQLDDAEGLEGSQQSELLRIRPGGTFLSASLQANGLQFVSGVHCVCVWRGGAMARVS